MAPTAPSPAPVAGAPPGGGAGTLAATDASHRSWPSQRLIFWTLFIPTALGAYLLTTLGTLNPLFHPSRNDLGTRFFRAQLEAMLAGRLEVTASDLFGECFIIDDRCYGYFGLTPSLLRLPVLLIAGGDAGNGWSHLFTFMAMLIGVIAAMGLVRAAAAWTSQRPPAHLARWPLTVGYLIVGPGALLFLLGRSAVYEEALAWGAALTIAATWAVVAWLRTGGITPLVLLLMLSLLAANARVGFALTATALGLLVALLAWHRRSGTVAIGLAAGTATLPLISALAVNWLKFAALLPDLSRLEGLRNASFDLAALERTGFAYTSAGYIPTKAFALLRPWGLQVDTSSGLPQPAFPEALIYLPGTVPGGIAYAPTPSLLVLTPLAVGLSLAVLIRGVGLLGLLRSRATPTLDDITRRAVSITLISALLVTATAAAWGASLTFYSLTPRYLVDAWPMLACGTALGVVVLDHWRRRLAPAGRVALTGAATALATYSITLVWWSALGGALPLSSPLDSWLPSSAVQRFICPQPAAWRPGGVDGLTRECAELAEDRQGLDAGALVAAAGSANTAVRTFAAIRASDPSVLTALAGDEFEAVRLAAAANTSLPVAVQPTLATDTPEIALALAANTSAAPAVLDAFAESAVAQLRLAVAGNPSLNPMTLRVLASDDNGKVRLAVAQNTRTPAAALRILASDEIPETADIARARLAAGTYNE